MIELNTDIKRNWLMILADQKTNNIEIWTKRGVHPNSGGRKINNETIKLKEFIEICNSLGYDVALKKRN